MSKGNEEHPLPLDYKAHLWFTPLCYTHTQKVKCGIAFNSKLFVNEEGGPSFSFEVLVLM